MALRRPISSPFNGLTAAGQWNWICRPGPSDSFHCCVCLCLPVKTVWLVIQPVRRAIARPPPLPYQDNELHFGPLYELTLRTFSAAKRGPCANDGQRECDTGLSCGARATGNIKKNPKHSVAQLQHHSFTLRRSSKVCCGSLQFCKKTPSKHG